MLPIIKENVDEFARNAPRDAALERAISSSHHSTTFGHGDARRLGWCGRREAASDGLATDRRGDHVTFLVGNISLHTPRLRHFTRGLALPNRYRSIVLGYNQLETL